MADETLTGAQAEVTVDTTSKEGLKKLVIKVAVIVAVIIAVIWLYNKFVR